MQHVAVPAFRGVGLVLSLILLQGIPKTIQFLEGWAELWHRTNPVSSLSLLCPFGKSFFGTGAGEDWLRSHPQLREPYKVGKGTSKSRGDAGRGGEGVRYVKWCVLEEGKRL